MATLGTLHANIQDTFNEAGIAIVSPHYEADPPNPMPAPGEQCGTPLSGEGGPPPPEPALR